MTNQNLGVELAYRFTTKLMMFSFLVKTLSLQSTFLWAAARLRTTRASHIAAAVLRATLAAAYAEEHDEHESTNDDQQDRQPVYGKRGEVTSEVPTDNSMEILFIK